MCARSFKNVLLGLDAVGEKDSFAKKKNDKKTHIALKIEHGRQISRIQIAPFDSKQVLARCSYTAL
jgi:hypothetical protein